MICIQQFEVWGAGSGGGAGGTPKLEQPSGMPSAAPLQGGADRLFGFVHVPLWPPVGRLRSKRPSENRQLRAR